MTSLSTCPACQGEYRSYEYPCKADGLDFMVHYGKCPNCGMTVKEIPSGLTEAAFERRERNRLLMEEANSKTIDQFLRFHTLSEYPYFEIVDREGLKHTAFTYEEAVHIGYYLYDPGMVFKVSRLGMTVKAEIVPRNAADYVLRVSYVIPVNEYGVDGFRFRHTFGCQDMDQVRRLVTAVQPRGVFFEHKVE